jgi:YidC/Oxa1 family membrane protein insertase
MEKRALLAVVLSVIVLIGYQMLFIKPKLDHQKIIESAKSTSDHVTTEDNNSNTQKSETNLTETQKPETKPETIKTSKIDISTSTSANERSLKVETPLYNAIFSTKGANIHSFVIKEFKDANGQHTTLLKKPLYMPPMSMGQTRKLELSTAVFDTASSDVTLDKDGNGSIVFTFKSNGIDIKRTYKFYGNTYKIDLKDEIKGMDEYFITLGSSFGYSGNTASNSHIGPVVLEEFSKRDINPAKDLDTPKYYKDNIKWAGQEDMYFVAAIVPITGIKEAIIYKENDESLVTFRSDTKTNEYVLYAGPKKQEQLKSLNLSLENLIDFGFFSIIAKPIFWLLEFLNHYLRNYGWSIIALTIILRVPFIPLINKGQSSMKKLQKLQPLMNEIKEKFKKDPARMQKEMMELYKKHKVNPMGGCLPIVIQIPVFFALYKVLLVSIELRDAPFIFWIVDLSAKDPYYVLPLVMGATMFIQQKMTPTGMDPKQAKIMLAMPIVFTFMFLNFSSGLVLYWLCSNLLSITQQIFVNKRADQTPAI